VSNTEEAEEEDLQAVGILLPEMVAAKVYRMRVFGIEFAEHLV